MTVSGIIEDLYAKLASPHPRPVQSAIFAFRRSWFGIMHLRLPPNGSSHLFGTSINTHVLVKFGF